MRSYKSQIKKELGRTEPADVPSQIRTVVCSLQPMAWLILKCLQSLLIPCSGDVKILLPYVLHFLWGEETGVSILKRPETLFLIAQLHKCLQILKMSMDWSIWVWVCTSAAVLLFFVVVMLPPLHEVSNGSD